MKKMIDKTAVVAEIKGLIQANELYLSEPKTDEIRFQKVGAYSVLNDLLHFLDTLEVKEIQEEPVSKELEKELDYDDYMTFFREHSEYINGCWGFEETWTFAQYCYKLGLKAQKGE